MTPLLQTAHLVLSVVADAPPAGLSRHRIIGAINTVSDKTIKRTIYSLREKGLIVEHIDREGVARYVASDEGLEALKLPPVEVVRQPPVIDEWRPMPWTHPIALKKTGRLKSYWSTDRRIVLPSDQSTSPNPVYPPRKPITPEPLPDATS